MPSASRTLEAKAAAASLSPTGKGIGAEAQNGDPTHQRKTGFRSISAAVGRGRQVRLEAARERVLALLQMHEGERIQEVLGLALYQEVKAGRACPSLEVLTGLASTLGVRLSWLLGLED